MTTETRYFISNLLAQDQRLPQAVRGHWDLENSRLWGLDIAFREDESRTHTGPVAYNRALLRRLAARCKRAGWDHRYLRELLSQ